MRAISTAVILVFAAQTSGQLTELTPDNWDAQVPAGKEVDAIYGDVAISNDHARGIVAATTPGRNSNMTVRNVSGCLIDFVTRSHESDQLSAFFPGRRRFPLRQTRSGENGSVVVIATGTGDRPAYETRYHMEPGRPVINVTSTWTNTTGGELIIRPEDDLRMDGGNEDIVRTPAGAESMFWIHDIQWQQAYAIRAPGFELKIDGNNRETVLEYQPLNRESIKVQPGEIWSFTRQIIVARDLPEIRAIHDELDGTPVHPVVIRLTDSTGEPMTDARLTFSSGAETRGTCVTDSNGEASLRLPQRGWKIVATSAGVPLPESGELQVSVAAGDNRFDIQSSADCGTVAATVTDGRGRSIPAKVEFIGSDEKLTPDWGPPSGESFVRNLAYTEDGEFDVRLLAGNYDVIVSHGPEYDAMFTTVNVVKGRTTKLNARIKRSVKTPGWVSADFHSHSTPSGDNTGSQFGRVLNLAAENIEFAPCTEHNRVSTYDAHIKQLGLESHLATVSGMELTGKPLPLNHQNVFPMIYRPRIQDGGGPQTDTNPESQIERLAAWDDGSEKLLQQNHPDIGWLFYDRDGNGVPDEGYERAVNIIDVMEIHPIDRILDLQRFDVRNGKAFGNQRMLNWFQLLNQGFRIYGVVNTDAHYNYHGSGGLRNWIQSTTDNPAEIDAHEMMTAGKEGRLIMSNGPFLEATFQASGSPKEYVSGQDISAKRGEVTVDVTVQCPNWIDIDTVFVVINGRVSKEHEFTRATHPKHFKNGSVKFKRRLTVRLTEDSHLVVATDHSIQRLGDVQGPQWGAQHPAALTNPVFVDVDGDGFRPNKDTLGFPLPVKFEETQQ
jgi:hypothetical protein